MDSGCVVEGIGSSFGLYWMDIQGVESISRLLSYSEYGNVLWYPHGFANCPIITGETAHPMTQALVLVSPNPNAGSFSLHVKCSRPGDVVMELYDVNGRLVSSHTRSSDREFVQQFDCAAFPDGMYLLRVLTQDAIFTEEVIIRR